MKSFTSRSVLLVGLVLVTVLLSPLGFLNRQTVLAQEPNTALTLPPPPFLSAAGTEAGSAGASVASFLDTEAGIAAYFKATGPISLNDVKALFRTTETANSDYVIGSLPIPNYSDEQDVHVYAHVDGWVLAYYLKADVTGEVFGNRSRAIVSNLD